MTYVEVRITCAHGHTEQTLATFVPLLFEDNSAWVGNLDELKDASWEKWSLLKAFARSTGTNSNRPNYQGQHTDRAASKGIDGNWRFYCRRCKLGVLISDSNLGTVITTSARGGASNIELGSLR